MFARRRSSSCQKFNKILTTRIAILTCLLFVQIGNVKSLSLERLPQQQQQNDKQLEYSEMILPEAESEVFDNEVEVMPVSVDGNSDMYLLVPASSQQQHEQHEENVLQMLSEQDESMKPSNTEGMSDMLMLESEDVPAMQILELPEKTMENTNEEAVIAQVNKENEKESSNHESQSSAEESEQPGNIATDVSDAVVDMMAEAMQEIEKEIETELVNNEEVEANKEKEQIQLENQKGEEISNNELPVEHKDSEMETSETNKQDIIQIEIKPEEELSKISETDQEEMIGVVMEESKETSNEDKKETEKFETDLIEESEAKPKVELMESEAADETSQLNVESQVLQDDQNIEEAQMVKKPEIVDKIETVEPQSAEESHAIKLQQTLLEESENSKEQQSVVEVLNDGLDQAIEESEIVSEVKPLDGIETVKEPQIVQQIPEQEKVQTELASEESANQSAQEISSVEEIQAPVAEEIQREDNAQAANDEALVTADEIQVLADETEVESENQEAQEVEKTKDDDKSQVLVEEIEAPASETQVLTEETAVTSNETPAIETLLVAKPLEEIKQESEPLESQSLEVTQAVSEVATVEEHNPVVLAETEENPNKEVTLESQVMQDDQLMEETENSENTLTAEVAEEAQTANEPLPVNEAQLSNESKPTAELVMTEEESVASEETQSAMDDQLTEETQQAEEIQSAEEIHPVEEIQQIQPSNEIQPTAEIQPSKEVEEIQPVEGTQQVVEMQLADEVQVAEVVQPVKEMETMEDSEPAKESSSTVEATKPTEDTEHLTPVALETLSSEQVLANEESHVAEEIQPAPEVSEPAKEIQPVVEEVQPVKEIQPAVEESLSPNEIPAVEESQPIKESSLISEQSHTEEDALPAASQEESIKVEEKPMEIVAHETPAQKPQKEEVLPAILANDESLQLINTVEDIKQENVPAVVTQKPLEDKDDPILEDDTNDSETSSMLTTIVQVPIQEVEQPHEPQQPATMETVATVSATTLKPLNVMDSVLNYVNASLMQQMNNDNDDINKQEIKDEETAFSSKLRRYDGAQVWRIVVQNDRERKLADELQTKFDGQLWKEVKQEVDYLLKPQVLAEAEHHVRSANLSRIVLIDNLQKVIEVENPPAKEIAQLQNRKGHRLTWQAYHRLEDIHGFFDYLAKTYPDICSVETIGYSIEKRPLKILKISNGNAKNPGIWIDGGMHAREWISPAVVTFITNQIVEGWDELPAYMRNVNYYIHAVANPDGYEYSHTTDRLWRKNMRSHGRACPGVDLNRNFGYKWGGKGTSANPCAQTYRGSKAFSEPETFYISKFISNFPRETFKAYLSVHSYGQYILYPWGYDYHITKDMSDLDLVARQAGTIITKSTGNKYTVGSSANTLYPAAGGSDDWAKGIAGIKYSYTIEMGDTGRYGFVLPAAHIEPNGQNGFTFVETVAKAITMGKNSRRRKLKAKSH